MVEARSSITVDCLRSSSSSSAISINLRLLKELVDEEVEPDAVCKEQAADKALSLSPFAVSIEKEVSYGENRSVIALKCTVTRARCRIRQSPRSQLSFSAPRSVRTLDQSRAALGDVFNQNIPPPIFEKPKQRRRLLVTRDSIPDLQYPIVTASQHIYLVSRHIFKEEPANALLSGFRPFKRLDPRRLGGGTHHPPGSAMAASWASLTFRSSRPFNDISLLPRNPNRCLQQQVSARCRLERWRHARKICVVAVGFQGYGLAGVHWH